MSGMNIADIKQELGLRRLTPESSCDDSRTIAGGYASDLLSDVMVHAPEDGVLITSQVHMNVVAVAAHSELAAVIFTLGREPEEPVRAKASEERIALFVSDETTFDVAGQLYALGLKGSHA